MSVVCWGLCAGLGTRYGSSVQASDTSSAIQARMDAAYLRMSPAEKMRRSLRTRVQVVRGS